MVSAFVRYRPMYRVMCIMHINTSSAVAEFHANATLAVKSWLSSTALAAFEMLLRASESIGMSVFVLHAILANIRKPLPLIILRAPPIVEAIFEAIDCFDSRYNATRCSALHNLPRSSIAMHRDRPNSCLRMRCS